MGRMPLLDSIKSRAYSLAPRPRPGVTETGALRDSPLGTFATIRSSPERLCHAKEPRHLGPEECARQVLGRSGAEGMFGGRPDDPTPMTLFNRSNQKGAPNDRAMVVNSNPATLAVHATGP